MEKTDYLVSKEQQGYHKNRYDFFPTSLHLAWLENTWRLGNSGGVFHENGGKGKGALPSSPLAI